MRHKRLVVVNDQMQQGYRYDLVRPMGRGLAPGYACKSDINVHAIGLTCSV